MLLVVSKMDVIKCFLPDSYIRVADFAFQFWSTASNYALNNAGERNNYWRNVT
jgi:hypothetical protein